MLRTYAEVKQAISSGDTVMSILEGYLSAIEANKDLNAFLEVFSHAIGLVNYKIQYYRRSKLKIKVG